MVVYFVRSMKFFYLFFIGLFFTYGCTKDKVSCTKWHRVTRADFQVDYSSVAEETNADELLEQYPQLALFRILDDDKAAGIFCYHYYNGLRLITEKYTRLVGRLHSGTSEIGSKELLDIDINTDPTVSEIKAISLAIKNQPVLQNHCLDIELVIDDRNHYNSLSDTSDYYLAWIVENGINGKPSIKIDATTGSILSIDDGKRF